MKAIFKLILAFSVCFSSVTHAQSADHERLKVLLKKEVESLQSGKGSLPSLEDNEKQGLTNKLGAMETHRLLNEVVLEVTKSPQLKQVNDFTKQIVNSTPPENSVEKAKEDPAKPQSVKDVLANGDLDADEEEAESKPTVKAATLNSPNFSDEERGKMLKKNEKAPAKKVEQVAVGRDAAVKFVTAKNKLYEGVPKNGIEKAEFGTELTRGSMNVVYDSMSINDDFTIHTCVDSAVSIYFESKRMSISDVHLVDKVYFDAEFNQKRSDKLILLRQVQSVKKGYFRETTMFVFRAIDQKPYIIKVVGNPCPAGQINYPNIIYLKDRDDKENELKAKFLPAEDMTVSLTKGYRRVDTSEVHVYDFMSDSISSKSMTAIEIVSDKKIDLDGLEFRISNNTGTEEIELNQQTDVSYLKTSSEIKSRQEKRYVYRFLIYPKVQKTYIVHRRHINLFIINNKASEYQHVQIDLLPLYSSQRSGG